MAKDIAKQGEAIARIDERTKTPPTPPPRQLLRDGSLTAVGGGIGAAIAAIVQGIMKP